MHCDVRSDHKVERGTDNTGYQVMLNCWINP